MHLLHFMIVLNIFLGSLFSYNGTENKVIELFDISDFSPGYFQQKQIVFENKNNFEVEVYLTSIQVQEFNPVIDNTIISFDAHPDFDVKKHIGEDVDISLFNIEPNQISTLDISISLPPEADNAIQNQTAVYYFEFTIVSLNEKLPYTGFYINETIVLATILILGSSTVLFLVKKERKS